ncbi:alpha/beta hydrolase [Lachnospiraceae bacterium ASD3451]|uniref:alpha/beta hydrolase n=1 Tax=Diplocloster agilis TaxID=2850323 RepID=UPI001D2951BA|nr:alpha/beta hydrolase [Diplocloster agilis]MBU9745170.1 alpha/beta hydrolase [Diplocloster agilis]
MNIQEIKLTTNPGASLTAYMPEVHSELANIERRPGILVIPGGAYMFLSAREAEPVALAYAAQGYHAFVLRYSVGKEHHWPQPLEDAQEAMQVIISHAEEWKVDEKRIAAVGFSAGGHLAAALGTMGSIRPAALILGYPCTLDSLGKILVFPVPGLPDKVDDKTPPVFLFSTYEDDVVPISNSVRFLDALNRNRIPFECHIFQKGCHGLALAKPLTSAGFKQNVEEDAAKWFDLSVCWLHNLWGDFPSEHSKSRRRASDMKEYSVNVTVESMIGNPAVKELLLQVAPALADPDMMDQAAPLTVTQINREIAEQYRLSQEQMEQLNAALKAIPYTES